LKKVLTSLLVLVFLMSFTAGSVFASSKMDSVIEDLIGTPYKSAGSTTSGFDCSGFTSYVFKQFKISLPRTSGAQSQVGKEVAKDDLMPGDLVFFNTSGNGVSHVGIAVGDGKFAHASSSKGVMISKLSESYWDKRYVSARRVMSTEMFEKYANELADITTGDGDAD